MDTQESSKHSQERYGQMRQIIETLYPMNRCLLGSGFDSALEFINHLIPLKVTETASGTDLGTWTVPEEWIVRDAWVKFNGEKIIDYKKEPLSLWVGAVPFSGTVGHEEFAKHLAHGESDATPYIYKFYDKDWGFSVPKGFMVTEGEYEVHIDTEYKPGKLKYGVHTIKGISEREIVLFAHLDHPFQANDNLSGVACLIDLVKRIKSDHTIKIVFCAETIGSIAYALQEDLTKVDFVIAVDICGNDMPVLLQKTFDASDKLNNVCHAALQALMRPYRKASFRAVIGSDEYAFNDPLVGIPGILLTTHPYEEYHRSDDTPEKIDYDAIVRTQDVILKIIEIYEKDFVPVRKYKGPLMLSKYGLFSPTKQVNLNYDYLFYSIDGKRSLAELASMFEFSFDTLYDIISKLEKDGKVSRTNLGQVEKRTPRRKK